LSGGSAPAAIFVHLLLAGGIRIADKQAGEIRIDGSEEEFHQSCAVDDAFCIKRDELGEPLHFDFKGLGVEGAGVEVEAQIVLTLDVLAAGAERGGQAAGDADELDIVEVLLTELEGLAEDECHVGEPSINKILLGEERPLRCHVGTGDAKVLVNVSPSRRLDLNRAHVICRWSHPLEFAWSALGELFCRPEDDVHLPAIGGDFERGQNSE
jgi:hypothetical protein